MVERIDIERALDDLTSNEGGMIFQGLAVVLAKIRCPELIACERKNDLGLDAYASVTVSPDGRGKGVACSTTGTFEKIKSDAEKVQKNYPDVSLLLFYTPEKVSQPKKADWAQKLREAFGFELVVISREDIIASLQLTDNSYLCATHLNIPVPYRLPLTGLLAQAHEAASAIAADWAAHPRLAGKPQIALNAVLLDSRGSETREGFTTIHLLDLLLQGRRLVLEAPAGRGKTTTLVQLAQAHGAQQRPGIAVLIDLPGWTKSGLDILEYIARMPQFLARGVGAADLARLSQSEPCLFLLNGWNEISELHSQDASDSLRTLERAFPTAGIIVATRTHHITPPLPGASRIRLLPLSTGQRFHYLEQAVGDAKARTLNSKLTSDRALNELTRTPFVLSEVTTIFRSGAEIPRTKSGLIGEVIGLMEQSEEHRSHLHAQPLRGNAADYLRALAIALTARGDVTLSEAEARTICYSAGEHLRSAGQIAITPEPAEVLGTLCNHHILERLDYPGVRFRFEHQQFQEYYSALMLRDALIEAATPEDSTKRESFARDYLNEPRWEEPLRMVAEALGSSETEMAAGKLLVEGALRVDPIFAASLSRLAGAAVPGAVHRELGERLRALYAVPNPHYQQCALAAMMATGSDAFADILIPLLTNPDQQVRLATYRTGTELHTSSLGLEWQQVVAAWPEQQRVEFISELTMHQGNTEIALLFANTDPSLAVRVEALRALDWIGQRHEVSAFLQAMPDPDFAQALQRLHSDDISPDLGARAISCYKALLAGTSDPKARLKLVLTLAEFGDADVPAALKAELSNMPSAIIRELSDYSLRPAIDIIRRSDQAWVSQWVTDRIVDGTLWRDSWMSFVSAIPKSLTDELLERASTEDLQRTGRGGGLALLAAKADAPLAKGVFMALCDHQRAMTADPTNQEKQAIDRQLRGMYKSISSAVVLEALGEILAQPPQDNELVLIAERFSRMGSDPEPENLRTTLPDALRQQLRCYLKTAVAEVIAKEDLRGEGQARLSLALAEVGDPQDMGDLLALLNADIDRLNAARAARARGDRAARHQGGMMSWSNWHTQAVVRLDRIQAEAVLLDLLKEFDYELDAAWALCTLARKTHDSRNIAGRFGFPARDYAKAKVSPPEWATLFDEDHRRKYTAAITERIAYVLAESRNSDPKATTYHFRIKELGKVLATLDPLHSVEFILQIAELPASYDGWTRASMLEALVFGHATLPTDRVLAILGPIFDQLRAHGVYNDNANLLRHTLCILPFVDEPARGIARIRDLLAEFRLPMYDQRDLLAAIGQCSDPEAFLLLRELAGSNQDALQHIAKDWLAAIANSGLPGARAMLLSFVDSAVGGGMGDTRLPDYAIEYLASRLAELALADSGLGARILQLASQTLSAQQRVILTKVIAHIDTPQSILAGLDLIDDDSADPVPYQLWKAIEDIVLEKRPTRANSQSYTLVPRAATDIRKRLFEMAQHDSRRTRSAYNLLGQIEEWRLEYGRPTSEPRHPAVETTGAWPPSPEVQSR